MIIENDPFFSHRVFCITEKKYARDRLDSELTQEEALLGRINKLEQMLGKLTLENEFLKFS